MELMSLVKSGVLHDFLKWARNEARFRERKCLSHRDRKKGLMRKAVMESANVVSDADQSI